MDPVFIWCGLAEPSIYDLVINLDAISLESACEMIICTLNQNEFKESPESQTIIEDFLLASQVKAVLAGNDRTKGLELAVSAEKGKVRISGTFETGGIFHSGKHRIKNDLIEAAQQVAGVKEVQIGLEDRPVALD